MDPEGSSPSESGTAGLVLKAETHRLVEVFEQAPAFMCTLQGPDHVFELANRAYFQLVGHRRNILNQPVRDALPEIAGQGYFELLDRVYQTGEPFVGRQMRVQLTRQPLGPSEEAFVDFVYQPLRDARGAVTGILAHGIDVTARVKAEQELAQAMVEAERWRRLYETALSNTADFNYVFDLDGRFVYVNRALLALWQLELPEAVGKNFFDLGYPPELAARLQQEIRTVIETREPLKNQTPYTSTFGTGYYEYIFVPVLGQDGAVEAVAGSTREISERMALEWELRELATSLAEADRRKDEFLAMLAHELRNPLAPLRSGLEVLKRVKHTSETAERIRVMLERQVVQLTRLVDDLLDVSRITRDKLELRLARVELREVLQTAIEASQPVVETGGHALTADLPGEAISLNADLVRLAQVFSNLLNNAAKYTPQGGQIWLTAVGEGSEVVVSVRDSGVGMEAHQLPTVFDLFTQIDHSLERAQGGLGIGLTLVKRLVELHGGTVQAQSEGKGRGSEFVVRLPILSREVSRLEEGLASEPAEVSAGRRVLVVDDNEDGAETLGELLALSGHQIGTAYNGQAAIDLLPSFQPEFVLLDIGMPGLNGYEVCRRIRERPGGEQIVMVALTGWAQAADRLRSKEAGFDHHLAKPVDPRQLLELLKQEPRQG